MRIISSVVVSRSADVLFDLSQNYSRRLEWDTYLSEARLLNGATQVAVGVESHCRSHAGSVMVSKYISCASPTHAAVEMVRGPAVFRQFSGTWRFRRIDDQTTEVQFIYNFQTRPKFLRWLIEPIIAAFYRRDMQRRAQAFKVWASQPHKETPVAAEKSN